MTESIQDIRRRLKQVESTSHITHAMRLISGARFRRTKERFDRCAQPLMVVTEELAHLLRRPEMEALIADAGSPQGRRAGHRSKTLYVLLTSNKGLCGGYNTALYKALQEEIDREALAALRTTGTQVRVQDWEIFAIGEKGWEHFSRRGHTCMLAERMEGEAVCLADAQRLTAPLVRRYLAGEITQMKLVYTAYINSLHQETVIRQILPIAEASSDAPTDKAQERDRGQTGEMEFFPSAYAAFDTLFSEYVALCLYRAMLEAVVCEHAARRSAMENAAKSAEDMQKSLSLICNRARQQAITNELIEIVAGAEAQQ